MHKSKHTERIRYAIALIQFMTKGRNDQDSSLCSRQQQNH